MSSFGGTPEAMGSFGGTPDVSRANKLALNARLFEYDAVLDAVADAMDRGDTEAWIKLPVIVQDRAGLYRDSRQAYRAAVAAGAVPDDRGPGTEKKETTSW